MKGETRSAVFMEGWPENDYRPTYITLVEEDETPEVAFERAKKWYGEDGEYWIGSAVWDGESWQALDEG